MQPTVCTRKVFFFFLIKQNFDKQRTECVSSFSLHVVSGIIQVPFALPILGNSDEDDSDEKLPKNPNFRVSCNVTYNGLRKTPLQKKQSGEGRFEMRSESHRKRRHKSLWQEQQLMLHYFLHMLQIHSKTQRPREPFVEPLLRGGGAK